MAVTEIRDALLAVTDAVYHFLAPKDRADKYIVWGETSADGFFADGFTDAVKVSGEVDYYTDEEYDKTVDAITAALDGCGASWKVASVGYDTETRRIVYVILWEAHCGAGEIY